MFTFFKNKKTAHLRYWSDRSGSFLAANGLVCLAALLQDQPMICLMVSLSAA
jgi:hypothetical protein